MRFRKPRLFKKGRALALPFVLWMASSFGVHAAQNPSLPTTRVGEIILYCQPGTPLADANALAAKVQATSVTPLLLADAYHIVLPNALRTDMGTADAVATLKADPRTRWVGASRIYRPFQASGGSAPTLEPNDPLYPQQWNLKLINMPQAWTLEQGEPNNNIADIDSGFEPLHPDLIGQYLPDSFNFGDNNADITANTTGADKEHGTNTSGIMIALTNNSIGIAGIDWTNIKCLALKATVSGADSLAGLPFALLLNSYAYIATKVTTDHIVALNMSYGGQGDPTNTSDPEYVALKALSDQGVLLVASAGNSGGTPQQDNKQQLPSGLPFVLSVGSVGRTGQKAYYTSTGKVDIAAPGGDQSTGLADGVLTTDKTTVYTYTPLQGTSFSAPHVTAVAALLFSQPGVTTAQVIDALLTTTNINGLTLTGNPDPVYGAGILDAYQALLKVSTRIQLIEPFAVNTQNVVATVNGVQQPIETYRPTFRAQINNVTPDNLSVVVNNIGGGTTTSQTLTYLPNADPNTLPPLSFTVEPGGRTSGRGISYVILFRPRFTPPTGASDVTHTVTIQAIKPVAQTTVNGVTKSVPNVLTVPQFTIQPHQLQGGLSMVSVPYLEGPNDRPDSSLPNDPAALLGKDVTLFRYDLDSALGKRNNQLPYAVFTTSPTDTNPDDKNPNASFHPQDIQPTYRDNKGQDQPALQIGVGYFARTAGAQVQTYGTSISTHIYRTQLHEGWNMIGDPYPFDLPFNTAQIQTSSGTGLTVQQAVDQGLMLPFLYSYVGGNYTFDTLPNGNLKAWQAHWIYVRPLQNSQTNTLTLILSPVPSSSGKGVRSVASTRVTPVNTTSMAHVTGTGSWSIRLAARAKNLIDTNNFIGMSSDATDGEDRTKAPKPPTPSPYVSLGMVRPNGHQLLYSQDLRSVGGSKSWEMLVKTDQANTDVVVTWPDIGNVPRNYRLMLTDKVTSQTFDLRRQSSLTFNTGKNATSRSFVVTVKPSTQNSRAVFSNIFINPSATRAPGGSVYEIGYSISQEANVEATILTFGGRVMTTVGNTRAVSNGNNRVVWNGHDQAGRTLPAGPYMLQLKAVGADGTVTREIRPFNLTR